jgi:hypothetical protein
MATAFDRLSKSWGTNFAAMQRMFKFSVEDLLANSISDPNVVCELMDCSVTVFVDEFSDSFNIFCCLLVLGRPEHSSSSTDTQPALKRECHSKTGVRA